MNLKSKYQNPPIREFELRYKENDYLVGTHYVDKVGGANRIGLNENLAKYGHIRKTKTGAKQALKLKTKVMRLHALAEQLDGLKEFKTGESNYSILFDNDKKEWYVNIFIRIQNPTTVYMTEECAEKICDMLNSGRFELEIEE